MTIGLAIDRPATQQFRHAVTGCPTAGPLAAPCPVALLLELRCVEAEEANAGLADPEAIPIAGSRSSNQSSPGLVERSSD